MAAQEFKRTMRLWGSFLAVRRKEPRAARRILAMIRQSFVFIAQCLGDSRDL
jgi:hypothetical protein